jgi:hypothetical protein
MIEKVQWYPETPDCVGNFPEKRVPRGILAKAIDPVVNGFREHFLFHAAQFSLQRFPVIDHIVDIPHEFIDGFGCGVTVIFPKPGCNKYVGMIPQLAEIDLAECFINDYVNLIH